MGGMPDPTHQGDKMANTLDTRHAAEILEDSAISADVAAARGYRTLTGTPAERDELAALGFKGFVYDRDDAYPALLVPMHNARGEQVGAQLKPATPRERRKTNGERVPIKYESPSGAPLVVDVPAFTRTALTNLDTPLWVTEGMKKTDALVSHGLAALGLTGVFNWRSKLGTLGDWEDIPLRDRVVVLCFDADALVNRNVQLAMGRLGAWLKSRGASKVHYVVTPGAVGDTEVKGVDDFFAAGGTVAQLAEAESDAPPGQGAVDAAFTDAFLVEALASEALEGRFTWASGLGWLKWNGVIWSAVSDVDPVEAVRQWASARFDAVLAEQSKDKSRNMGAQITGWRGVLSKNRIGSLASLARGVSGVQSGAEEFDADPDLLTVLNGTVHLPSGVLRPHDPADRITKCAGASYRSGATHPMWDKALDALPKDVVPWYRERLGQSATGYKTPDHRLVISQGDGNNGKSSIVNVVSAVMGDYGRQLSDRVLLSGPGDHPTELMDLRGLRYAVLEETPEERHLNTHRLKQTVGTEEITARHIRQDSVTFKTTHSLFVNTNHIPTVDETDHGTWRRLALLRFPYTFVPAGTPLTEPEHRRGDPVMEYIHDDPDVLSAALSWLVEGAQGWYAANRMMSPLPATVAADTLAWRAKTDKVMGFLADCTAFDAQGFVSSQDMLKIFNQWLEGEGNRPWNAKTLGDRFGGHSEVKRAKVEQGKRYVQVGTARKQMRGWSGIRLTVTANPFD